MTTNNQLKKKAVLVTLADKKYLEYAKQVFAGAYFNAGWKGDYMLLAHDCSSKDTAWFRRQGILVKHCKPIYKNKIADTLPVIVSKLYLFTPEFKKWSHIIYADSDILIRSSLEGLLNINSFASVENIGKQTLKNEIIGKDEIFKRGLSKKEYQDLINEFKIHYDINRKAFCAGFFVLNTAIITDDMFSKIKNIISKYHKIAANADQFALNIYFLNRWTNLPPIYDIYISDGRNQWGLALNKLKGIVIHIFGQSKPWDKDNYFFEEWAVNLKRSNQLFSGRINRVKSWSSKEIDSYSKYLEFRGFIFYPFFKKYLLKQWTTKQYFRLLDLFEKNIPFIFQILKRTKRNIMRKKID